MIDIHCHILPCIDDGPLDIQESIKMAKIAASDGISKIVATPHIKNKLHPVSLIKEKVELLNRKLKGNDINIEILQGADVNAMLDVALFRDYTINSTNYILIEFPHSHLPKNLKDIIFKIIVRGYRPIITHPERNPSVIKNPGLLFELVNSGVLSQITADSITGGFGIDIQECAKYLLKKGVVNFIATDAHSSYHRPPVLSEGVRIAEKIIGREKALRLVTLNPESVLKGESLCE